MIRLIPLHEDKWPCKDALSNIVRQLPAPINKGIKTQRLQLQAEIYRLHAKQQPRRNKQHNIIWFHPVSEKTLRQTMHEIL